MHCILLSTHYRHTFSYVLSAFSHFMISFSILIGMLDVATCPNQDPLEATTGLVPLLGIDVWEHAYLTQYGLDRAGYLEAFFKNINWKAFLPGNIPR